VLPPKVFAYLQPKFRTPAMGILICGAAGLIGLALNVNTAVSLINFGAFLAFTSVNACVIALYFRRRRAGTPLGVLGYFLVPAIGVLVDLYLLYNLGKIAQLLGACWLLLGVLYLAILTRGFRRPPPEIDVLAAESDATPAAAAG